MLRDRMAVFVDYLLRLAFFALVPRALVYLAAYFPLSGTLFNVAFAVVVVVFGAWIRGAAEKRPWLKKAMGRQLQFEAYYREHPGRRFLYYAFYPIFFIHWLRDKDARKEFLLFKGYTIISIGLLLASNIYQYFRYWRPELHLGQFVTSMAYVLVVELFATIAFLIPISTTIITFSLKKRKGALALLLVVAFSSAAWEIVKLEHLRDPIVTEITRARVGFRAKADPARAEAAESAALRSAWALLDGDKGIDGDGKIEGPALVAAQTELRVFYKRDEVKSFDLWATPRHHPRLLILYSEQSDDKSHAIWLALKKGDEITHDVSLLPADALLAMKHAANH